MSSDEVIRHIISDITTRSSNVLKSRKIKATDVKPKSTLQQTVKPVKYDVEFSNEPVENEIMDLNNQDYQPQETDSDNLPPLPNDSIVGQKDRETENTLSAQASPPKVVSQKHNYEHIKHIFLEGIRSQIISTHVSETLAAFFIRAVVLDPKNAFHIEKELSRDEVSRLIDLCVEKIVSENDPIQETVKMQVYFDTNFPAQDDFLHREKLTRIESCSNMLREILDAKSKTIPAYEAMYSKIVLYVLLRAHVGNATDVRVVRETTTALESVFPQSELNAFISLTRTEKEAQLNGLAQLVTGIRLFNKQLGKGGESIDKLPELCALELREISILLHNHTQQTEHLVQQYKAVLDYENSTPDSEVTPEIAERVRCALVFRRQYLVYLDALQEQVSKARQMLISIGEKFDSTMQELKATCKSKTAVPVGQVYPQFIMIYDLWSNWTDELFLLAFKRGILDQLNNYSMSFTVEIPSLVDTLSMQFRADIEPEILPENEVIEKAAVTMVSIAMVNKTVEVIHPGNTTQYYKLPVEYGGFCPYSLVTRDGLVVPGDKNIGMIRYKDKLFSFANLESMVGFCEAPERYMRTVIDMAKANPGFVQLLHLYNYFPTVEALERAKSYTRQRLLGQMPIVAEIGCQVETHIVETQINSKYHWNEWDLRREALMLVNLKDKHTHSTQTALSHFRRESETQYYQPKDSTTQTKKTSKTSMPRNVVFYAGLRNSGKPLRGNMYASPFMPHERYFKTVNLTVDHDGSRVPCGDVFGLKNVMPPIPNQNTKELQRKSTTTDSSTNLSNSISSVKTSIQNVYKSQTTFENTSNRPQHILQESQKSLAASFKRASVSTSASTISSVSSATSESTISRNTEMKSDESIDNKL
ncbi:hypothetical protein BDV3_001497 [Batrachochytrium dendrobatidis]|uniref:Cilia- and flagella-associated protein 206 n=1 Tax=Batrachochytrium dendrobatidis (strain JEL423) TaxID=403673 RepID=A0A177WA05_BATDL|nr:hypothetical protein BDEG_21028 [Batrachochytrium dendrobatidis JEL423]